MIDFAKPHDVPVDSSAPTASLESILCTEELQRRPSRPPDYEKENQGLVKLVSALADSPTTIFRTLAETIQDLTQCDSAGLSLLTRDGKTPDIRGERFYWPAIAACGIRTSEVGPRVISAPAGTCSIRIVRCCLPTSNGVIPI